VIDFARNVTANRGSATGSKSKNVYDNPRIMTNILGYFDKFSAKQNAMLRDKGHKIPLILLKSPIIDIYVSKK
jgi:hypothetical protein